jgi:antirestriction protein ArdC
VPRSSSRSARRSAAQKQQDLSGNPAVRGTDGPQERANLYDEVTARIVAELEAGRFPWVQPWGKTGATGPALPRNALTTRSYSGINILILWGAVIEQGWPSQGWLTFRQAQEAGGCVRKGEHGVTVVYADRFTPEAEKERAAREGGRPQGRALPQALYRLQRCAVTAEVKRSSTMSR